MAETPDDLMTTEPVDAGSDIPRRLSPGQVGYTYVLATDTTEQLDKAIDVRRCLGGLDIWLNQDWDGPNQTATLTLYNCSRATDDDNYATECIPLDFDSNGSGVVDTNIMHDGTNALNLWSARVKFLGFTIDNTGGPDQVQVAVWCIP
jgi:hypothetical protein